MSNTGSGLPADNPSAAMAAMGEVAEQEGTGTKDQTVKDCDKDEKSPEKILCPPHDWELDPDEPGVLPDDAIAELKRKALPIREKAERATNPQKKTNGMSEARGHEFEAKAIDENRKKKAISACGRKYRCRRPGCGQTQEIDIVFADGQVAECCSKTATNVKTGKSDQAKREKEIQQALNKENNSAHKPMAKIDGDPNLINTQTKDKPPRTTSQIFEDRGYQVEVVD